GGKCWYKVCKRGNPLRSGLSDCQSNGMEMHCDIGEYRIRVDKCCYHCEYYSDGENHCTGQHTEFYPEPYSDCASYSQKIEIDISGLKKRAYISQDGFEIVKLQRGFTEIIPLWKILNKVIDSTKKDCFICGGYARYCASPKFNPIKAGDVDIYSEDKLAFNKLKQLLKYKKLKIKVENDMAITYERPESGEFHYMPPVQAIKPLTIAKIVSVGSKETILSNFDFTVIRAAIESPNEVVVDKDFIHDESNNVLRLKNIHCPVSSALRCLKYAKKGYWLRPLEALKLFIDWDNRSDEYRSKLIDFLDKAGKGTGLTQEEVDELEALMMVD
ncbi:hypothetical protein LCGC14_2205590, partial [marine sediment metagenome]